MGYPVDPATGGGPEKKVLTDIDRLPGADPGGEVDCSGCRAPTSRLRRARRSVQPGHPGGVQVALGQVDGVGEWTGQSETLPAAPVHVAAFLTDRAEEGCRPATLRASLAAIAFAHRAEGLDSPTEDEGVVTTMKGLSRLLGRGQRQAPGLTREQARRDPGGGVPAAPRQGRSSRDAGVREENGDWWTSPWRR